jgi:HK97 family phage major capsid protein
MSVPVDIESLRGLEAHEAALAELVTRHQELESEANGRPFNDEQRTEFDTILEQRETLGAAIEELKIRKRELDAVVSKAGNGIEAIGSALHAPNIIKVPDDVHDLAAYRQRVTSVDELAGAYRDGAMRIVEKAQFPALFKGMSQDDAREHVAEIIDRHADEDYGAVNRRIIGTDNAVYREAWAKYMSGGPAAVSGRFQAALQTYSDADGGYAIPFTIDPTFVLTTDGALNAIRTMARVETITTKAWSPVTTGGVTASYAVETAAAADAAPGDVANPVITPIRAHVLVGFTAEYSEDYGPSAIQAEVGRLIRDAKDVLEATKFILGTGTNEPDGVLARLITDGTSKVDSATANTFALVDVDALEGALGDRFIGNAQFLAARKIYQLIRGFGTAGQPANSIYDQLSGTLRGYPAKISNTMDKTTTTGSEPLLFGDFSHFVIVDRLGLSTEFIPQLFDSSGNVLGRRGVYARWRNDSGLLTVNAFRFLSIKA